METESNEKKKATGQISFKTSVESKVKMERAAHELGLTLSEYIKLLLDEKPFEKNPKESVETREKPKNPTQENAEIARNSDVFFRELSEKTDTTNDLLGKLVETLSSKTEEETNDSIETRIEEEVAAALYDQEERIRSEHLMLRLSELQKNLFINLMSFRKEKGEEYSETVESFFFYLVKEKFYEAWFASRPDGFDKEFKEAFAEHFEPKETES